MSKCNSVEWSSLYIIGDEKIDAEHKRLFELASAVQTYKNDKVAIRGVIDQLVRYTKVHFANEERYMESIRYTYLDAHKKIHKEIVTSLQVILEKFKEMSTEELHTKVLDFVKNSLVYHIMVEDKKVQHFQADKLGLRKLFAWKNEYMLHNVQIDEDHHKLFEIALRALEHNAAQDKKQHIRQTIIELNNYMKEHFEREESYMESISYPKIEEHKALHARIIDQINDLIKRLPTLSLSQFEKELLASIDIWLVNHIVNEDHKIICFERGLHIL